MKIAAENKAKISILGPDGQTLAAPIDVQFNPEQYSKSWNLSWNEVGQTLQWGKTTPADFILTLHFDSYEEGKDVTSLTKRVRSLLDPSRSPQGSQPMGCLFQWGKAVYKGVVKSIKEEFTLFLPDGTPVRSVLTLTLQPWPSELQDW